jgi:predicted CXXCH cytochrome family protein
MKFCLTSLLLMSILLVFACDKSTQQKNTNTLKDSQADYVGRDACRDCHKLQYDLFVGSDHDDAMDVATDSTVLGDFNTTFTQGGVTSRFFKKDGQFFVFTEGENGEMQNFKITHTFGIRPLQQYLVEFPGGRYQMLPFCWDTRPQEQGGQRWFFIYQDERIPPNDVLFWTRMTQNYNYMCSECHSTHVKKQFDRHSETYNTTWSEIDVSCEACHGPGAEHIRWAKAEENGQKIETDGYLGLAVRLKDEDNATWIFKDTQKGTAERTVPLKDRQLVDMCARCHARRTIISEEYVHGESLLQTHRPALLEQNLYFPDGQIQDEVYVYASFLQSKMYDAGVTCKDCHEPHSGKNFVDGNALCYRCHMPSKYGVKEHHFHDPEQNGGLCVECHMPERTYMVIDPRRDHSMRVPRPDFSDRLETPNACTKCHDKKSNQWAAEWTQKWYGDLENGETHYGEIFYAGRRGYVEAHDDLLNLANDSSRAPMIRATALNLLQAYPAPSTLEILQKNVRDADPLIRAAAAGSFVIVNVNERFPMIRRLLDDPVRLVRVSTAQSLADVDIASLSGADKKRLEKALDEFKETQYINADHSTAHLNLGVVALHQGDLAEAERSYKKAIEIEPMFPFSYINLADLYRLQNREADAEKILLSALDENPDLADIHHALGLAYVRQRHLDKAMRYLKKAAELSPETPRFSYVYAVGLHSTGKLPEALQVLQKALQRHPYDRDILFSLVTMNRDAGDLETAHDYAVMLVDYFPEDEHYKQIEQQLRDAQNQSIN